MSTTHASSPALLSRLPEQIPATGPSWLVGLRREAADRLRDVGFPTRKTEAWRFTPVKPVVSVPFDAAAPAEGAADWQQRVAAHLGAGDDTFRLLLVNGRPLALGDAPAGVEVVGLAEILASDPARVEPYLGRLGRAEHFAALNAAMFEDGLFVHVADGARLEQPIHVIHVAAPGSTPTAAYPRLLVVAGEGSDARLIETYLPGEGAKHLTNVVTEIALGANARLDHLRVTEGGEQSYHMGLLAARLERDAGYVSRTVTLGGALHRLDIDVLMTGEGAECTVDGVYHVHGRDHVDHHTYIDHAVPHCTSHEHYRGLLDGAGRAVFDGTIVFRRDAQRSSAAQENHNLLLSDDAGVNTKPHLEIDADDVTASHGATIGALNDESLFYLRARGLSREQAEAILIYAFAREILDEISHEPTRRRLSRALLARLPHGDTIEELE